MPVWLLRGPCSIELAKEAQINGSKIEAGNRIVIPVGRSVFLKGDLDAFSGTCTPMSMEESVYDTYYKIARSAIERGSRIVILGPPDSGKTTLSSFIINMGKQSGLGYVTVDVGQNELYAPGFVAGTPIGEDLFIPGSYQGDPYRCFVGSFTPSKSVGRYIHCARKIATRFKRVVIDSDGWVSDWRAIESKIALSSVVEADLIVAVGFRNRKYVDYLGRETGIPIIDHTVLVEGVSKSREQRRIHRERLIAKLLQDAKLYNATPDSTPIYGLPVFNGAPLGREEMYNLSVLLKSKIVYAEKSNDVIVVVANRVATRLSRLRFLRYGWERGLIASAECNGKENLSLIYNINYKNKKIRIKAPCKPESITIGQDKISLEGTI